MKKIFIAVVVGSAGLLIVGCAYLEGLIGQALVLIPEDYTGSTAGQPALGDLGETWSLKALTTNATAIVKGHVIGTRCSLDQDTGLIFTDAEVEIDETFKGTLTGKVIVRYLGGQIGDLGLAVSHEPVILLGEEVIVFLSPYTFKDQVFPEYFGVVGGVKGKLTVRDGYILEVQLPEAELITRIRAILAGEDIGPDPYFAPLNENIPSGSSNPSPLNCNVAPLSYSYTEMRWPGSYVYVNYYVKNAMSPASSVLAAIQAAASAWNSVGSRFQLVYKGTTTRWGGVRDGYNVIEFAYNYGNTGWPARTLTWYYNRGNYGDIVECDMQINTYYNWAIGSISGRFDVQNVVTHEFGHFVRLLDLYRSQESEMTMYGYVSYAETKKRTLETPDKRGLLDVYGYR